MDFSRNVGDFWRATMQPSSVYETRRRQNQGKNIVDGMPLCRDL
jgi:hypothetical protein